MSDGNAGFDGPDVDELDTVRLSRQGDAIRALMTDRAWRTLAEIEARTGFPQASISARLRDMRKAKFGGYSVQRRRRSQGTWEYCLGEKVETQDNGELRSAFRHVAVVDRLIDEALSAERERIWKAVRFAEFRAGDEHLLGEIIHGETK